MNRVTSLALSLVVAGAACAQSGAPPAPRKLEGAVGLMLAYKPAFSGSSDFKLKAEPAGFLRYGRFTITGAGGFTTRRQDDVERGLDAELVRREGLRVSLSLRFDGGRKATDSLQLRGMGDIASTVRARLGARWDIAPRWQLGASTSVDALGRVGGYLVAVGLGYTLPLTERQRLQLSVGASGAGDRWMQAWYGVTPEQSAASGYPVYRASEGLRDMSAGVSWRIEIDPQWAAFAGASASHLLGGAAASPLASQRTGWGLSGGVARRF